MNPSDSVKMEKINDEGQEAYIINFAEELMEVDVKPVISTQSSTDCASNLSESISNSSNCATNLPETTAGLVRPVGAVIVNQSNRSAAVNNPEIPGVVGLPKASNNTTTVAKKITPTASLSHCLLSSVPQIATSFTGLNGRIITQINPAAFRGKIDPILNQNAVRLILAPNQANQLQFRPLSFMGVGGRQTLLVGPTGGGQNLHQKVMLIPTSSIEQSPKKIAVITVPNSTAKKPTSSGVVQNKMAVVSSSSVAVGVNPSPTANTVINLTDSPIKVAGLSPLKVVVKTTNKPQPQQHLKGQQMIVVSSSLAQTVFKPGSQLVSSAPLKVNENQKTVTKYQYVKLITTQSHDMQINKSLGAITSNAAGSLTLLVPSLSTPAMSTSLKTTSSVPMTSKAFSSAVVTHRPILPKFDKFLRAETLHPAVAHMAQQAALTMRDAQLLASTSQSSFPKKNSVPSKDSIVVKEEAPEITIVVDGAPSGAANKSAKTSNEDESGQKLRRPCNCSKSQCLKLYCECFANGEFCFGCNCVNCANNLEHEDDRGRAIRACLERNPFAFHPKIGKGRVGEVARQHSKGCHCKRSGCLKNYCECYEAKIPCTDVCKCFGCKNYESNMIRKSLMRLADAAEVRVQQQIAASNRLDLHMDDRPPKQTVDSSGKKVPYTFVTMDVIKATCSCLVATSEESAAMGHTDEQAEQLILEEFGRCLDQVIEAASRSTV